MAIFYVGFRVEISNRFISKNFVRRFNTGSGEKTKILEMHRSGRISAEKIDKMLVAHGQPDPNSNLANFSLLTKIDTKDEACRVVKIINVLGNDRLIKERVSVFISGRSVLNALPELEQLKDAFVRIEKLAPNFTKVAWYYAPEAIFV